VRYIATAPSTVPSILSNFCRYTPSIAPQVQSPGDLCRAGYLFNAARSTNQMSQRAKRATPAQLPFGPDRGEYFGSGTFRQGQIVGPRPRVAPSSKDSVFLPILYRHLVKLSKDQGARKPTDTAQQGDIRSSMVVRWELWRTNCRLLKIMRGAKEKSERNVGGTSRKRNGFVWFASRRNPFPRWEGRARIFPRWDQGGGGGICKTSEWDA
jgi:hypothetical protein